MSWDTADTADTVRCINDKVQSLPDCPACGDDTDLCTVALPLAGGTLVSYVLLCGSIRADARRMHGETPRCTFTLPMNFEPAGIKL